MNTSDGELPNYGSVPPSPGNGNPPMPPAGGSFPLGSRAYPSAPKKPVNQKAVWSIVTGGASLIGVCCVFGGFIGIAAIALGVIGRAEVIKSNGAQTGVGFAIAGIITGAIAELSSIVMLLVMSVDGL